MGSVAPPGVTVLAELGRGGHSVVYRVRRDRHTWAMKVFRVTSGSGREELAALRREAAIIAWTGHPAFPRVHEVGVADGHPYLIMDLIEGRSLAETLRDGPLGDERTGRLGARVAGALAALHAAGLVHRDVKPQNLMLPPDGGARLIDLGMAWRATATAGAGAAGTLRYCAPEQAGTLDRPVDGRSDLYALGGVLYECLTGRPPFPGTDAGQLLRAHATETPPAVPGPLGPVVARLLAKNPDDRYQTGTQLAADLGEVAEAAAAEPIPFTGRDRELALLSERARRAGRGAGGFAVVAGGRGAGKSRLLREVAGRARRDGLRVLDAACPEEPRPLGPLRGGPDSAAALLAAAGANAAGGDATEAGPASAGLLLCLDDAHRADEATLAVLRQLTARAGQAPLLVLLAVDDADRLPAVVSHAADPVVTLGPLDSAALVAACAAGRGLGNGVVARLAARAGNTPFEVREYVNAVVDSGALTPYWGTWRLEADGLDRIDLSGDLQALLIRRAEGLTRRDVLAAAAVIGTRFPAGLAAIAGGVEPGAARRQLAEAVSARVLRRDGDQYAFAHDRLRDWLLETTDPAVCRDAHQRVAEHLDRPGGDVYTIARHYLDGHRDRHPGRLVRACRAAGDSALADNSPGQALALLEPAYRIARAISPAVAGELGELLGTAYYRVGHLSDAVRVLNAALAVAPGPIPRARILLQLSRVHQDTWDTQAGLAAVHRGLAELGRALPRGRARLAGGTLVRFLAALAVERTGIGFGRGGADQATRRRLEAHLYRCGGTVASLGLDPVHALALLLRSLYPVTRLGLCEDYVRVRADVAGILDLIGLRRLGGGYRRPAAAAARLGDEAVIAYVSGIEAAARHIAGRGRARDILADTADPQHKLDAAAFVTVLGGTLWLLLLAGLPADAEILYREGRTRLAAADLPEHSLLLAGASVAAAQGRAGDAASVLTGIDDTMAAFRHPSPRVTLLLARAQAAVEGRDLGAAFDRVDDDLAGLGLRPSTLLVPLRSVYAYIAYGRLEQGDDLPAARRAVARLREAAASTLLKAHAAVCEAHLRLLEGDPRDALRVLDRAGPVLRDADAPLATFEAARVRARALHLLGQDAGATADAAGALALAVRHGWPHRARWVRDEFGDTLLPSGGPAVHGGDAAYRERLTAVTTLSLAAARITDPAELTRVVLDETIRLLAAERAYLFLAAGDGTLRPHLGRDNTGADLGELTEYGTTLVERARHSREPLVVAGTDDAAVLGSQSIVTHGLRSVLVSPLIHDDRLLGVLYLDSRVAAGIFTPADVGVLAALASHIAAALETTRAAELAGHVRDLGARVDQMQRLDSLGQLAGGIAHDFNNVLGIIAGFTELLRDELPEGSPLAGQIAAAVDKGAALTRQLLTFGRGQPGNAEVHDLAEILTELDPMLRRTLGEHVSLHVDTDTDTDTGRPCLARIDRGRLEQVVVNLAANARDAMPGGGDLRIRLGRDGSGVRLAVSDTGTGMDEEALARAFEPFYTTKPAGKGTGLGLAGVYSIIRNAGGTVRLESKPGRGTTVSVCLPAPAPATVAVAEPPPVVAEPPPDGLRVLVVDDCAELAEAVGSMLRSAGYAVRVAHSPTAAARQVADVDLLVTDVVMPNTSGPQLVAAVRATRPSLPVVYMSGYLPAGMAEIVRSDRDAVLVEKPLTRSDVLTAVGRLFAGR